MAHKYEPQEADWSVYKTNGTKEPAPLQECFSAWCKRNGRIQWRDQAGAKWLWMYMPPELREMATNAGLGLPEAQDQAWWTAFGDACKAAFRGLDEPPE